MASMADLGAPQYLDVDGVRVRYLRSTGRRGTTAVVMTSPFPESLYAYDEIWAELARAAPLIAFDLPGFGQSEGRPDLMMSEAMGTFVIQALGALGLQRVHVIGPDVGTSALLFAASQEPGLFESLIVGSGGTDVEATGSIKDIIIAESIDRFTPIDGGEYAVNVVDNRTQNKPAGCVLDDYRMSYSGRRAGEAMAYLHAYKTALPLLQSALAGIDTPVLSIWGAHDPIVLPESAEVLDRALRHTRSVVVDSGHFVWHDRPTEYAEIVLEWINGGYTTD